MVRTHLGIDPSFSMVLPTVDTGTLQDVSTTRYLLPSTQDIALERIQSTVESGFGTHSHFQNTPGWSDSENINILDYNNLVQSTVVLSSSQGTASNPLHMNAASLAPVVLARVDFRDGERLLNTPALYKVTYDPVGAIYAPSAKMAATGYYWKVKDLGGAYPTSYPGSGGTDDVYMAWMPDIDVTMKRTPMGLEPTPTGQMLLGDLDDYMPLWSVDLGYLDSIKRRYIEYGTWVQGAPGQYANPVTFQADSYGGGIVTFGISQMISREHVWANVSTSEAYMDFIARDNHLNLLGHMPDIDLISNMTLEYVMEDRLELYNSEGWLQEMQGSALRGETKNLLGVVGMATNPLLMGLGLTSWMANAVGLGEYASGNMIANQVGGKSFGNGELDEFIEKTVPDYNGANWFPDNTYVDDGEQVVKTMDIETATMLIRPTVVEDSTWDSDNPKFDLYTPGLDWLSAPGSVKRHQLIRGREISVTMNMDLVNGITGVGANVWVYSQLYFGGKMVEDISVKPSNGIATLNYNLNDFVDGSYRDSEMGYGASMWTSDGEFATSVPAVRVWVFRDDPSTITNMVSHMKSILFADTIIMKMQYESDYITEYNRILMEQNEDANALKPLMVVFGGGMFLAGVATGNVGSAYWGADLIVSTFTGQGIADHLLKGAMNAARAGTTFLGDEDALFTQEFVDEFTYMHLVSDKAIDLILSEAMAELMSMGMNGLAGSLARGAGATTGSLAKHRLFGSIDNILEHGSLSRVASREAVETWSETMIRRFGNNAHGIVTVSTSRKIGLLVVKGMIEYAEIIGEVIIEMTFDSLLAYDEAGRPLGGAGIFLAVMTVSVLTSAALNTGDWGYDGNVRLARDWTGVARVSLSLLTVSLALSQVVMRMPVLAANAA
ncbi:MAG: hypothetical protein P1Q69_03870 [Candidatus Thorarchaeota archaeon]|nr:hypothetical protein [Candidatus Thorarchaeota archaeon]